MKKYFVSVIIITSLFYGCLTTNSAVINIPTWEEDQKNAIVWFEGTDIGKSNRFFYKNINGVNLAFSYTAYLFKEKIKIDNQYIQYQNNKDLTITGFPRAGSTDDKIFDECVKDFRLQTGARPGDYFWIDIFTSTIMNDVILKMNFLGRIEANGSVTGWMYRRN